jgi:uncharacterized protein (DUF1330 family)
MEFFNNLLGYERMATGEPGMSATPTVPAYLLVQGTVTDREGFKAYSAALPAIYRKFGGEYLAIVPAPAVEVAEGSAENRSIVIVRFPSKAAAQAFWYSPEYAEARQLRAGKGEFFVTILEGLAAV